jgi:hypothetical protein
MTINTFAVPVVPWDAVLPGVRSPWAMTPSGTGLNHAPAHYPVPATLPTTHAVPVMPRRSAVMARSLAVTAGLPTENRKQYVHKTRVNAGGDGASGPHPEREPA